MPQLARGPGFWLQPQLAGQEAVIDPDPDSCHYCPGLPKPAVGYVQFNYAGTDQWFWRYGVCRECIEKKRTQARVGIDLILYDPDALSVPPEPEPVAVPVETNAKGQCLLF